MNTTYKTPNYRAVSFLLTAALLGVPAMSSAQVILNVADGTTATQSLPLTGPIFVVVNEDDLTTGTLVITGGGPATGNTYSGATMVEGGTVQAGADSGVGNAFSPFSDLTLSGGSTVDLNGNASETIPSLNSTDGTTVVTNSGNSASTLTIDDTNSSLGVAPTYRFDGHITDAGAADYLSIDKAGPGTLILGGVNNYHGETLITGGTLQAATGSGAGNAFSPNSNVVLSGGSTIDLNGNNERISALESEDAATVVTNSGSGDATLTVDNTGNTSFLEYAGTITDAGPGKTLALTVSGTDTILILTNTNTYGGGTTITSGALVVGDNGLGSGNVVNSGTGILATPAALVGPVANVAISGNYTQSGTASLFVVVANSPFATPNRDTGVAGVDYDTYTVAGSATLGGVLLLAFEGENVVPAQGQRYVVLTAANPIASMFTGTELGLPGNYIPLTTYNDTFGGTEPGDSAVVTLVQPFTSFSGLTQNQVAVGRSVDNAIVTLNGNGELITPGGANKDFANNIVTGLNLASFTPGGVASSLDQLSPQRLEILRNIAFDNYALDVQSLDDMFARERYGHHGIDMTGFAINDSTLGATLSQVKSRLLAWSPPAPSGLLSDSSQSILGGVDMSDSKDMKRMSSPDEPTDPWNVFIDGGADLGDLSHNADTTHSSYTTGRVRAGADYRVTPNMRFGAMFGYSHTDADMDEEGSKAKVDSYTPGLYATYADKQGFYANALVTATVNEYSTDRDVIIPGVNRDAKGTTEGEQYGANLDGGYEFHKGNFTFGPSAGLTYVNLGIDGFNEDSANAASLSINDQSAESLRSRLGGTARYCSKVGSTTLTPHLSAYWQHEFLDGENAIASRFEGLPGGEFTVETPAADRDTALLDFGVDAEVCESLTLFIDYTTEAGGDTFFGQSATGGVKVSF